MRTALVGLVYLAISFFPLCLFAQSQGEVRLQAPQDITLSGAVRKEEIVSALGTVELRWPRKVEQLFGRTPQRALADAMLTASRALRQSGFPNELRSLKVNWKVVFMDEEVPETQVPRNLVDNCHPAWMTPPGNIYVVAQRVAAGCGGGGEVSTRVADARLVQILLHEIGHGLEARLLGSQMGRDRMLSEGFASWFEQYSADYSSVVPDDVTRDYYTRLARQKNFSGAGFIFTGSAQDYALASQYFWAIVDKKGIYSLMQVYQQMREGRISFFEAINKRLYWDRPRIENEIQKLLK